MTLGTTVFLRRIDTDFVCLSPVLRLLGIASPEPSLVANSVVISEGSSIVVGTWVPLATAQNFAQENPTPDGLNTFLSDTLFERFPPALRDFHRSKEAGRLLNQYGPHFNSTLVAQRARISPEDIESSREDKVVWDQDPRADWSMEDLRTIPPLYPLSLHRLTLDDVAVEEVPLSATEQEMFHEICSIPDWEKENAAVTSSAKSPEESVPKTRTKASQFRSAELPLRRSKRVANSTAIATQTRSRTRKRATRCEA